MPVYTSLETDPPAVRRRAAERLLRLREQLTAEIPPRTVEDTLLLATWNIRELDSPKYGERTAESFLYLAEIISRFDLIAVQEVREDLRALERLKALLGPSWECVYTDVTAGTAGNGERMAFLFDRRKVRFTGLACEIVLPDARGRERALQFARTPYLCGFDVGWAKLDLVTVHIYYGRATANDPRRVQEIEDLAQLLGKRARQKKRPTRSGGNDGELILLGDFNIFNHADATMAALESAGFVIPEALRGDGGSNLDRKRHYDQIAFHGDAGRFGTSVRAGVFDFTQTVFLADDEAEYVELMGERYAKKRNAKEKTSYYKQWRTHQMSDHLVLWAELDVGFAEEVLRAIARRL